MRGWVRASYGAFVCLAPAGQSIKSINQSTLPQASPARPNSVVARLAATWAERSKLPRPPSARPNPGARSKRQAKPLNQAHRIEIPSDKAHGPAAGLGMMAFQLRRRVDREPGATPPPPPPAHLGFVDRTHSRHARERLPASLLDRCTCGERTWTSRVPVCARDAGQGGPIRAGAFDFDRWRAAAGSV